MPEVGGAEPTRRAVLVSGLSGMLAALTACSSSASRGATPAGSRSPSDPATTGDQPQVVTTTLGTRHVTSGEQIATSDVARFRDAIGGTWRGAWRDTSGANGTSDLTIALDLRRRTVRAVVAAAGPILAGADVATAEYEIDLLGFARTAPSWTLHSPQLGTLAVEASGGTSMSGRATEIPNQPEITAIEFEGTRTGYRVDGSYTMTRRRDGSTLRGTMAMMTGGTRAVPHDPSDTSHDSPADIQSGAYAATLVSADDLTTPMKTDVATPSTNGGRIEAYAGIDTSNALAATTDGSSRSRGRSTSATTRTRSPRSSAAR